MKSTHLVMNKKFTKVFTLKLIILSQLLPAFISLNRYSLASDIDIIPNATYLRNIPKNNFYILGPGDQLGMKVSEEAKELNSTFVINGEGVANLKRLKRIYVEGLTVEELTSLLNKEYSQYVIKPNIELEILRYRPINVYIDGEVENPGKFIINGSFTLKNNYITEGSIQNNKITDPIDNEFVYEEEGLSDYLETSKVEVANIYPTLIDLIRQSGGITTNANLKEIIITRKNNLTAGGGRIRTKVNLLKVLNLEDLGQNIRILDGDTIYIPKGDNPSSVDVAKAIKSNINPSTINVYIGGRVEMPGKYKVGRTSSLNDAIAVSGGTKVLKGSTRLIRYNSDGSIDKRKFRYNGNAKVGSLKNPYLRNGDIIFVGKSGFNIASEVLNEATSPLQSLVSIYGLYKVFD